MISSAECGMTTTKTLRSVFFRHTSFMWQWGRMNFSQLRKKLHEAPTTGRKVMQPPSNAKLKLLVSALVTFACKTDYPGPAHGINWTVYHDNIEWDLSINLSHPGQSSLWWVSLKLISIYINAAIYLLFYLMNYFCVPYNFRKSYMNSPPQT